MTALDWSHLLHAGLTILRLKPWEFWSLAPFELALMLGLSPSEAPMPRARLDALIAAHPDEPPTTSPAEAAP